MDMRRVKAAPFRVVGRTSFAPRTSLTQRQRDITQHIARGLSNKEIANELGMAENTVKVHLQNIMVKLGLSNRAQVAVWAVTEHVVSIDELAYMGRHESRLAHLLRRFNFVRVAEDATLHYVFSTQEPAVPSFFCLGVHRRVTFARDDTNEYWRADEGVWLADFGFQSIGTTR